MTNSALVILATRARRRANSTSGCDKSTPTTRSALAAAASVVEHDLVRAAPSPFQKGLGEGFELAVVSVSVGDEVRGFGSVPRLGLSFICWHWRLADVRAGHIMSPRHIWLRTWHRAGRPES